MRSSPSATGTLLVVEDDEVGGTLLVELLGTPRRCPLDHERRAGARDRRGPRLGPDGQRHRPARDRRTRAGAPRQAPAPAAGHADPLRPQLVRLRGLGDARGRRRLRHQAVRSRRRDREGARARRRHARAPRGRAGRRARGRRASRRRRDRHRRDPAAPRVPGSSRHSPDAHRRRAGRLGVRPRGRGREGRRADVGAPDPRLADRHQRQRGRLDDPHDPRRGRGDPADDDLHAHDPRRPPGPPQRAQRDAGRRPRHLARVLLPGALHQRRVQADALRGHRRVPRAQDRGHPGLRLAGQDPRLPRRGAAARHRPLLGALQPGALRGAARGRARQRRRRRSRRAAAAGVRDAV